MMQPTVEQVLNVVGAKNMKEIRKRLENRLFASSPSGELGVIAGGRVVMITPNAPVTSFRVSSRIRTQPYLAERLDRLENFPLLQLWTVCYLLDVFSVSRIKELLVNHIRTNIAGHHRYMCERDALRLLPNTSKIKFLVEAAERVFAGWFAIEMVDRLEFRKFMQEFFYEVIVLELKL